MTNSLQAEKELAVKHTYGSTKTHEIAQAQCDTETIGKEGQEKGEGTDR